MMHTETQSTSGDNRHMTQGIGEHDQPALKTFDHNLQDLENDIEPDNNFFSTISNNYDY